MSDFLSFRDIDPFALAGACAAFLSLLAFFPYIRDTWAGRTHPDRATWLIWSVLASMSAATNLVSGAEWSRLFLLAQVGGTALVFLLSIRGGSGHYFSPRNLVFLGLAGLGMLAWTVSEQAVYALAIAIGVSALGGVATALKAYHAPQTETMSCWLTLLASAGLGVLSVGVMDPMLLAYPVYLLALYATITVAISLGRLRDGKAAPLWTSRRARRGYVMPPPMVPPVIFQLPVDVQPVVIPVNSVTSAGMRNPPVPANSDNISFRTAQSASAWG